MNFNENKDFYPTPIELVEKMLEGIDFKKTLRVLEPSAGSGNIAEAIERKVESANEKSHWSSRKAELDLDVVEKQFELIAILKEKGFRVVSNDFLAYETYKKYDLIVMNPPFSEGSKHLEKAIQLMQSGGRIVCLLNAAFLNGRTILDRELLKVIEKHEGTIEVIKNAFSGAERKTDVDVALIKLELPKVEATSILIENLRKKEIKPKDVEEKNELIGNEFIKNIVEQYKFELEAGLKLIDEFYAAKKYFLTGFDENKSDAILKLSLSSDRDSYSSPPYAKLYEEFVYAVRMKYWRALFSNSEFTKLFTTKVRSDYFDKVKELKDYDFSLFNIYQLQEELSKQLFTSVEESMITLYDELSAQYAYSDFSSNVYLYNGWKSNKAWKINDKVVIRLNAYSVWTNTPKFEAYKAIQKLSEIEKTLSYLDGQSIDHSELEKTLKESEAIGKTSKIQLKYFEVAFFKKGTCHIKFTNKELLKKFNYYGSSQKGWLPPTYGQKEYSAMSPEEKAVIDAYEGEKEYDDFFNNPYYKVNESLSLFSSQVVMLQEPEPAAVQAVAEPSEVELVKESDAQVYEADIIVGTEENENLDNEVVIEHQEFSAVEEALNIVKDCEDELDFDGELSGELQQMSLF